MASTRRLSAILAADVAGYSRLMGADEDGTHDRLRAVRGESIDPKIAEHRGRIVKTTGDGLLAEFASVVDAVRCAVEVQDRMAERNVAVPAADRIEFRIGINLGDVIVDGDDIIGDRVNIAARLEGLAEPGGVLISSTVYDQVRDRLPFTFADHGDQQFKNIARPVRVYRVTAKKTSKSEPAHSARRRIKKKRSLCFVDDDVAELIRFRKALSDHYDVGTGTTLAQALENLRQMRGDEHVDLFVLDMYFPREEKNKPEELVELGLAWENFRKSEAAFKVVLSKLGQDFEGGRNLAREVNSRNRFTKTPFVFFTRKGNLLDAITAYENLGALSVIRKPDPRVEIQEKDRETAYDQAILDNKDSLIIAIDSAIRRGGYLFRYRGIVAAFFVGLVSSTALWGIMRVIG